MHHEATLISTIAVGFVLAFAFGYVADRLRLPALVGYLVAGVMVGPFTPGFVADGALAAELAEVGIILLMFGVGLHFSVSDLLAVRGIAVPGAVIQVVLATLLGTGLCVLWGWNLGAGVVFGLSLSVASTVVLLKALEECNLLQGENGRIAVGWLVVEDLIMVLALVLLPAVAQMLGGTPAERHADLDRPVGIDLVVTLAKVGAFAATALTLGSKAVPWMLTRVARTGSRELFTLSILAVAIGIAYGSAQLFGVSLALGAFVAGVVLSDSPFGRRAAENSLPFQDAFSVLFFVSVGMLFDPKILVHQPVSVLAVLALIVVGKSLIALAIVMLLRYPLGTGLIVSAGLAQVGEFSFILIGLGISAGIVPGEARDLVVAGALLSIMANPLIMHVAGAFKRRLEEAIPAGTPFFGQRRYEALKRTLSVIKARQEERNRTESLKLANLLERFPVLQLVEQKDHDALLPMFRPRSASPGEKIIRRGDRADRMYFISSGSVEVKADGRAVKLAAGDFFGEMALLTGDRRNADVIALDFCQLLAIDRREFNQFMARHPAVREAVTGVAETRRRPTATRDFESAANGSVAAHPASAG